MAQLLAIEWDGSEARVAVARTGGAITIEQAFSVDLSPRLSSENPIETNVGERLTSALSARGISGRGETLVAVGRANIELRVLNIPPVPEDELPDLVRFQAQQQFTSVGDDWPLDFVVLDLDEEGTSVLAAAISSDLVNQINATCEVADVAPKRLVLRPFAAASLLRSQDTSGQCRLMVDLLADEVDLTVLVDQQVVFMRTVRRPTTEDVEQSSRALLGEIRRTMVAAQNQLGGRRVDSIVVFGVADDHSELKAQLEEQLSLDVELLNPFDGMRLGREIQSNPPDHPGRFAPLLGMLMDEGAGKAHAIDFLNPRKRVVAESNTGKNVMSGVIFAAALLCIAYWVWPLLFGEDPDVVRLRNEYAEMKKEEIHYQDWIRRAEELEKWSDTNINWLDEIHELSEKLKTVQAVDENGDPKVVAGSLEPIYESELGGDRLVVREMTARGDQLAIKVVSKGADIKKQLEAMINDDRHDSSGGGFGDSTWIKKEGFEDYVSEFRETISVVKYKPPMKEPEKKETSQSADKETKK